MNSPALTVRCRVLSANPWRAELSPDWPDYPACDFVVDYSEAVLADLGPQLLTLYASLAGPPVTRDALIAMAEPVVTMGSEGGPRAALLDRAQTEYASVLARARRRVDALMGANRNT